MKGQACNPPQFLNSLSTHRSIIDKFSIHNIEVYHVRSSSFSFSYFILIVLWFSGYDRWGYKTFIFELFKQYRGVFPRRRLTMPLWIISHMLNSVPFDSICYDYGWPILYEPPEYSIPGTLWLCW